uniref:Uncharacterized protein n=1 Tax=Mycena chlorophos TaxID=658473 RepID=A0ABQ0KUZ8_MYCCL|nr:predicted protein [Mycena chlorophos]
MRRRYGACVTCLSFSSGAGLINNLNKAHATTLFTISALGSGCTQLQENLRFHPTLRFIASNRLDALLLTKAEKGIPGHIWGGLSKFCNAIWETMKLAALAVVVVVVTMVYADERFWVWVGRA